MDIAECVDSPSGPTPPSSSSIIPGDLRGQAGLPLQPPQGGHAGEPHRTRTLALTLAPTFTLTRTLASLAPTFTLTLITLTLALTLALTLTLALALTTLPRPSTLPSSTPQGG